LPDIPVMRCVRKVFLIVAFILGLVVAAFLTKWIAATFADSQWKRRAYFGLSIETPFRLPERPIAMSQVPEALIPFVTSVALADSERMSGDIRVSVTKLVLKPGTEMDLDRMTEAFLSSLRAGSYTSAPERTVEALRLPGLDVRRYFLDRGKLYGKEVHSAGIIARKGEDFWHIAITFGISVIRPNAERILDSIEVENKR
jgi:hypothetical protein